MKRPSLHTAASTLLALALAAAPNAAYALEETDADVIAQLARVIRWSGVITSIFVIVGAWLILRFTREFIDRLSDQFAGRRLLFHKLATFFQFVVYVGTTLVVILLSVRLDDKVLAILGGTAAVSIGFAMKDLVASFVAGIMIMADRPFQVGDRVEFGGEYGDIVGIGLRSVRLRTLTDNIVTIPNNKFLTDITSCGNYGALHMQVVMDFFVGIDQDLTTARDVVTEAALTSRYIYLPKDVTVLVNQVIHQNHVAVRLRLKAYVLDTKYEKIFETDVNLRVMQAFQKRGILPPAVLHRTLGAMTREPAASNLPQN